MAATGLLALPHEMLARIKSHIHSLADHVHFSLTCRTLKDLYDDKFWKFACMSAGWGLLQTTAKTTKAIEKSKFADKAELWGGLARLVVKDADRFETFEDVKGWTTEDSEGYRTVWSLSADRRPQRSSRQTWAKNPSTLPKHPKKLRRRRSNPNAPDRGLITNSPAKEKRVSLRCQAIRRMSFLVLFSSSIPTYPIASSVPLPSLKLSSAATRPMSKLGLRMAMGSQFTMPTPP